MVDYEIQKASLNTCVYFGIGALLMISILYRIIWQYNQVSRSFKFQLIDQIKLSTIEKYVLLVQYCRKKTLNPRLTALKAGRTRSSAVLVMPLFLIETSIGKAVDGSFPVSLIEQAEDSLVTLNCSGTGFLLMYVRCGSALSPLFPIAPWR